MAEKSPADPRVTALGLIIKLTDDVFKAPDFDTAASLTVNSSHSLLRFKSAVLVEVGSDRKQVIAQYGQTELYPHSEQAQLQKKLAATLDFSKGPMLLLNRETLAQMEGAGADALGERYARDRGYALKVFPAEWKKWGRAAGPIRNAQMADYADALIAFWDGESSGTRDMIRKAEEKGLKVYVQMIR